MAVVAEPEQVKTASGSGERRFATVNPVTGEVVQEYPVLPSDLANGRHSGRHHAWSPGSDWLCA
jgi:hypothetical protein